MVFQRLHEKIFSCKLNDMNFYKVNRTKRFIIIHNEIKITISVFFCFISIFLFLFMKRLKFSDLLIVKWQFNLYEFFFQSKPIYARNVCFFVWFVFFVLLEIFHSWSILFNCVYACRNWSRSWYMINIINILL